MQNARNGYALTLEQYRKSTHSLLRMADESNEEDMFDYYFTRAMYNIAKMMKYEEILEVLDERYGTKTTEPK